LLAGRAEVAERRVSLREEQRGLATLTVLALKPFEPGGQSIELVAPEVQVGQSGNLAEPDIQIPGLLERLPVKLDRFFRAELAGQGLSARLVMAGTSALLARTARRRALRPSSVSPSWKP